MFDSTNCSGPGIWLSQRRQDGDEQERKRKDSALKIDLMKKIMYLNESFQPIVICLHSLSGAIFGISSPEHPSHTETCELDLCISDRFWVGTCTNQLRSGTSFCTKSVTRFLG